MRTTNMLTFVAMIAMSWTIFSVAPVAADQKTGDLNGPVHTLESFKSVPDQLNYQGFLVNASDSSTVTATLEMTFRLCDSETKGAQLWAETHSTV